MPHARLHLLEIARIQRTLLLFFLTLPTGNAQLNGIALAGARVITAGGETAAGWEEG